MLMALSCALTPDCKTSNTMSQNESKCSLDNKQEENPFTIHNVLVVWAKLDTLYFQMVDINVLGRY